ncbi:glycosyltransferase [Butyricimonas hominis]|uniref:Glycosyltransferase n=1 Tax=Butyricimonas hominis TaxID=2763032 RepID=A0ABR7CW31_9BACT|nr:glycosyltransferase [Butyricimonas hominis]MBC5619891.1 glycosyltransferase [Butyricimonas hominis]
MKVFMLANPVAVHTQKWVKSLSDRGINILLYSFRPYKEEGFYKNMENAEVRGFTKERNARGIKSFFLFKLFWYYIPLVWDIKRQIRAYKPDLVHSHCISDNGLFGVLSGFHPLLVSVWGTDIFVYPSKSGIRKRIIRFILKRTDHILSTSHVMAEETRKYTSRKIEITPFGVDVSLFRQLEKKPDGVFTVGIVKTLEYGYGIDVLIDAFALFRKKYAETSMKLRVVGDGSLRGKLEKQAEDSGVGDDIIFEGRVPNHELPIILNDFDVFVALSRSESFGVAIVEAMACQCPVIVSDAPGFVEIVEDGINGLIVPRENVAAAAEAMERLFLDDRLRLALGTSGRERVEKMYDWQKNVDTMIALYQQV